MFFPSATKLYSMFFVEVRKSHASAEHIYHIFGEISLVFEPTTFKIVFSVKENTAEIVGSAESLKLLNISSNSGKTMWSESRPIVHGVLLGSFLRQNYTV